jgi:hypothetical protein
VTFEKYNDAVLCCKSLQDRWFDGKQIDTLLFNPNVEIGVNINNQNLLDDSSNAPSISKQACNTDSKCSSNCVECKKYSDANACYCYKCHNTWDKQIKKSTSNGLNNKDNVDDKLINNNDLSLNTNDKKNEIIVIDEVQDDDDVDVDDFLNSLL